MIKESIKNILLLNGVIKMSYKDSFKSYYGDISLCKVEDTYIISGCCKYTQITDIDIAVNYFCELWFNPKNIALIYQRLKNKKLLNDIDFENVSKSTKKLFKDESILIEKEIEAIGISKTIFPDEEEAKSDFSIITNITNIVDLKEAINIFNDKYISIDHKINTYATFIYTPVGGNPYEYSVGLHNNDYDIEYINKLVKGSDNLVFKNLRLSYHCRSDIKFEYINIK